MSCGVGPPVKILATQTKRPEFQYPKLTKIPGVHGDRRKLPASKGAEDPQRNLAGETHRITSPGVN